VNDAHRNTVVSQAHRDAVYSSAVRVVNALAQLVFPVALVSGAYGMSTSSVARRYCTTKRQLEAQPFQLAGGYIDIYQSAHTHELPFIAGNTVDLPVLHIHNKT
jgi:hypothetical protein